MKEIYKKENTKEFDIQTLSSVLESAHERFNLLDKSGVEVVSQGKGFGLLGEDTEIKADKYMGEVLVEELANAFSGRPLVIEVEGAGKFFIEGDRETGEGSYYVVVDPLDGSLNYKAKGETLGLPFSSVVTVFDRAKPTFSDCILAGVVDLRTGDIWTAEKDKGCFLNGKPCKTSDRQEVDLLNGIVIAEMYYPENREMVSCIFGYQKGWLRNPGSAAYEMAMVASGNFDAFICDRQKSHELGAAYLLVKEAGGEILDHFGKVLDNKAYRFESQVPVVVAASTAMAEKIVDAIKIRKIGKSIM